MQLEAHFSNFCSGWGRRNFPLLSAILAGDLGAPSGRLAKLLKAREEGPKNKFLEETPKG
jgi:hypothetical protein